ncbi:proline--tRNA ligase [Hydrogenibacillus sp. N12]|uniref:proline--tRNA ligase n=1 Tax=Hydrogenibacillus sp. N12 TaxID=2866627 RepID=UPI001C7D8585|nr:proline--tRNA ligase [Hydrogenibacillus sp. N12]QZA33531.1 proline--tRNA ligase [Hydrogenibacillus sp. N12]
MRQSRAFIPTMRDVPAEAEVASHRLLLRAGYIRQVASGVYTYLPLAWRVLKKAMAIIREEMDAAGGQEILMPALQPAELWQATGRWDDYGPLMMRLVDRHERPFALGPTHEEVITALVRDEVKSYRRLPLILYQIQTKFRDEYRPRFGLLRGREFIMKDAYSFDRDEAGLEASYRAMYRAYVRIFERMGLKFRAVEADAGAIGGSYNHEFMVLADVGEDTIAYCTACDYAANVERAEVPPPDPASAPDEPMRPLERAKTPGIRTVAEQAAILGLPLEKIIKNVVYLADGAPVVVLVRGDHQVNEVKVKNFLGARFLEMADEATIRRLFGAGPGFVGPIGARDVRILADHAVRHLRNASTGANEDDWHYVGVNPGRDFQVEAYGDFRVAQEGDACPRCGAPLAFARGIEVGHVFKLGTKYSAALGAVYLDEDGRQREMLMGSYGIGVSRVIQAAVEQSHDEDGIIWPPALAPFDLHLLVVNAADADQRTVAEGLYDALTSGGIDVLYDDRPERAGVKFKDADLIGIPLQVIVGSSVKDGEIELKIRRTKEKRRVPLPEALETIRAVRSELE